MWPFGEMQEFVVIPDIVGRIIVIRGKDQQHGVGGIAMPDAPDHRRDVKAEIRPIEKNFASRLPVIDDDMAAPTGTNQKLVAGPMGMFPSYVRRRNIEHHKITLGEKRHLMLKFTYRQIAAHVVNQRQPVQFNFPSHPEDFARNPPHPLPV